MVYSLNDFMDEHKDDSIIDDIHFDDHEISLHPLNNQVGGHTRLLLLNAKTICKPLNNRELNFYQNIPKDIQLFVPKFKGVIRATFNSDIQLDSHYSPSFSGETRTKSGKRKRDEVLRMKVHKNPNIREVMRNISLSDTSSKQYFLVLENVTSKFEKANILDLKMGTRQYSDEASLEKKIKQMAKCAATTSALLGVRLCGMQVYQASEQNYFKRDKYWGRQLNEQGLKSALSKFFHNGRASSVAIIEEVLLKLGQLRSIIEKQASFRFYSCSLLIVYEGSILEPNDSADIVDVDVESSSNSSSKWVSVEVDERDTLSSTSSNFVPISEETVFLDSEPISDSGEKRLCSMDERTSWMLCNNTSSSSGDEYSCMSSPCSDDDSFEFQGLVKGSRYPIDFDTSSCPKLETKKVSTDHQQRNISNKNIKNANNKVEVRIIDFANATFKAKESATSAALNNTAHYDHYGPDGGFITGLDSLKKLLTEILAER